MKFSEPEELIAGQVLSIVDYDLHKLAAVVDRLRHDWKIPASEPVFMQDVLNYLLEKPRFAHQENATQKVATSA